MNFEKNEKIRILKKMKKNAGDIILHMCTKNHNHMRYSSWDIAWDRIFCHFLPFYLLKTKKNKILKKWKKHLEVSSFSTCATKNKIMMYANSDMECDRHNFLSF